MFGFCAVYLRKKKMKKGKGPSMDQIPKSPSEMSKLLWTERNTPHGPTRLAIISSIKTGDLAALKRTLDNDPDVKKATEALDNTGWNGIFLSIIFDQPHMLRFLLEIGADVEIGGPRLFSPMTMACRFSRSSSIAILLEYGADPCRKNFFGGSCLHVISRFSTAEIAEMVFGKDWISPLVIDAKDSIGMSPLHYSVHTGKKDMCAWLISHGADTNAREANQATPFITACHYGNTSIMELLISKDKLEIYRLMEEVDDEGMNALHHAVFENKKEATEMLLQWGSAVDRTTLDGSTPLHLCATNGHSDLVPILVERGGPFYAFDGQGNAPLHCAAAFRQIDTAISLIHQGADINQPNVVGCTSLYLACAKGYTDMVECLLTLQADYSLTDCLAKSCLHVAVEEQHWEVVEVLLKTCHRSMLSITDLMDLTALHLAASLKDIRFAKALVAYEELIFKRDLMGRLPLHYAARYSTSAMVKLLAKATKDINTESHDSKTPLHLVCEVGNTKSALILINMGADINDRDVQYHNTLMVAASSGSTSLVIELISQGAKINCVDREKNTALHMTCSLGHISTVSALLDHGASVVAINSKGETPLLAAINESKADVVGLLLKHASWEQSMSVTNSNGDNCLNQMIVHTPQAVKILLDNCWKTYYGPNDKKYRIEICFKYLDTLPDSKHFRKQVYKPLMLMIENDREDLLSHPVCQSFLAFKWNTYGRYSLLYNLIVQGLFMVFAAIFIVRIPQLDTNTDEDGCNLPSIIQHSTVNGTNSTTNNTHTTRKRMDTLEYGPGDVGFSVIGMTVCSVLIAFKEIRFLITGGMNYALSSQFCTTMSAIALFLCSFYPIGQIPCLTNWRFMCLGFIAFAHSSSLVFMRIDYIGLYFSMFYEVFRTIIKMVFVLLVFLIMLALPMKVIFREQDGFKDGDPFPLTVLAMTVGELNFRDMIVRGENSPFTTDMYILFVIFVFILNITFMNMMIGAAVGDINNVEKRAYLTRLKNQVSFLEEVETSFLQRFRWRRYIDTYVIYPNEDTSKLLKIVKKLISYDAVEFISKNCEEPDSQKLHEELKLQNERIDDLKEMVSSLKSDLKKMSRQGPNWSSGQQDECPGIEEEDEEGIANLTYVNDYWASHL